MASTPEFPFPAASLKVDAGPRSLAPHCHASSLRPGLLLPQDQKRMEKISKRVNAIEEVNNNVKLLTEMVMNHSQGGASGSSEDLMKVHCLIPLPSPPQSPPPTLTHPPCCPQELYQRCERMRPTLFRLASDTEDNDEALGEPGPCPA